MTRTRDKEEWSLHGPAGSVIRPARQRQRASRGTNRSKFVLAPMPLIPLIFDREDTENGQGSRPRGSGLLARRRMTNSSKSTAVPPPRSSRRTNLGTGQHRAEFQIGTGQHRQIRDRSNGQTPCGTRLNQISDRDRSNGQTSRGMRLNTVYCALRLHFVDLSLWETYIATAPALGDNSVNLRGQSFTRLSAGSFCLDASDRDRFQMTSSGNALRYPLSSLSRISIIRAI